MLVATRRRPSEDPRRHPVRTLLRSLITAVVAAGAMTLPVTAAQAAPIKESTIKSECRSSGGTYSTASHYGIRFSSCTYKDSDGDNYRDHYINGNYNGTTQH
jgi:hypothetical protein